MRTRILFQSSYSPCRGGHAPGDLRDAFGDAIDAYESWADGDPEPTIEVRDGWIAIRDICGLLWNCTDVMPSTMRTQLGGLFRWPEEGLQASPMPPARGCSNP